MDDLKEQYFCIKFCFILGKTALEMYEMLKTAFGDNGIWKKTDLSAQVIPSQVAHKNVDKVCKIINKNR
jgi:hypothetical protein